MIILSASGFEPAYRGSDITVVLVTPVNTGAANRSTIPAANVYGNCLSAQVTWQVPRSEFPPL